MPRPAEPPGRITLPPLAPEVAAAALAPPRLPPRTLARVATARAAAAARVPVLLAMPAGAGRLRVARALHAVAGGEGGLVVVTGRRPALATLPPGAALHLDVGALSPEAAIGLEALLDDGTVWVLAACDPHVAPPEALRVRLGAVALRVAPLAERLAELPALAADVVAGLARRAGRPEPALTADVLDALAARPWPGDVAELEAVLARAWLVAGSERIEPAHLVAPADEPAPVAPRSAAPAESGPRLEYLLAELAHELRNPLVTVKTFAGHLPALLEDGALRERFSALAAEAIDRMDGLLENVLDFARLRPPQLRPIAVGPLLDRLVAEVEPELSARAVRVRRVGDLGGPCTGDPDHVAYGLRNLLAGVAREVPSHEEIVLDCAANGVVSVHFATGDEAAARLRRLAAPSGEERLTDPTLLPLAFTLARAALERSGGVLEVVPESGGNASLVVRLPTAVGEEA